MHRFAFVEKTYSKENGEQYTIVTNVLFTCPLFFSQLSCNGLQQTLCRLHRLTMQSYTLHSTHCTPSFLQSVIGRSINLFLMSIPAPSSRKKTPKKALN